MYILMSNVHILYFKDIGPTSPTDAMGPFVPPTKGTSQAMVSLNLQYIFSKAKLPGNKESKLLRSIEFFVTNNINSQDNFCKLLRSIKFLVTNNIDLQNISVSSWEMSSSLQQITLVCDWICE